MTTKEQLLTLLEARQGSFVSGEELAGALSLSRAAVCTALVTAQVSVAMVYLRSATAARLSQQHWASWLANCMLPC